MLKLSVIGVCTLSDQNIKFISNHKEMFHSHTIIPINVCYYSELHDDVTIYGRCTILSSTVIYVL